LMRKHGTQGVKRRGKPWRTTIADPSALRSPDLVNRDFTASRSDQLWVARPPGAVRDSRSSSRAGASWRRARRSHSSSGGVVGVAPRDSSGLVE
jgi:hypothetical protein